MKWFTQGQTGHSLIEIILTTMVVTFILTALAASMSMSARNTQRDRELDIASTLAQQVLEVFHREKYNLGWDIFVSVLSSGEYCLNTLPANSDEFAALHVGECTEFVQEEGLSFQRRVTVGVSANEVVVTTTVLWLDNGETKQTVVEQTYRPILQ